MMENTMSVKEYIMKSSEKKGRKPEIRPEESESNLELIVNYLSLIIEN